MKIDPAAPNSLEWLAARAGVVTASEMDQILTPTFKAREGEMPRSYLARKLAEKWLGSPLAGFQSLDMEFGQILEEEAIPFYELETGEKITRVGLITTDDGQVGCSPDGLLGKDSGIEIKCPRPDTHVRYLLNNEVPKDYLVQVHAALYVTGRPRWQFMSYCRRMPPLILNVDRDEEIQAQIQEALEEFLPRIEAGWKFLCERNGGPPRLTPFTPKPKLHETEVTP